MIDRNKLLLLKFFYFWEGAFLRFVQTLSGQLRRAGDPTLNVYQLTEVLYLGSFTTHFGSKLLG